MRPLKSFKPGWTVVDKVVVKFDAIEDVDRVRGNAKEFQVE